jgi:LuxR family maltose regulon positive regulatory protein
VAGFVDAFTGSHRFVLDYLVEEVLNSQPEDVRGFLLDTSVLPQLTGPLCDALTGHDDGRQRLEILERGNLFVVPLDDQRQWYRYHHLFADALRARLLDRYPDRVPGLHQAASRWHAEHGLLADAVVHAIAGDDVDRAADLVELALPDLASTGMTAPCGSGCAPCRTTSSGGARCWPPSWPGRGSPKAISTEPSGGSMMPNGRGRPFGRKR